MRRLRLVGREQYEVPDALTDGGGSEAIRKDASGSRPQGLMEWADDILLSMDETDKRLLRMIDSLKEPL